MFSLFRKYTHSILECGTGRKLNCRMYECQKFWVKSNTPDSKELPQKDGVYFYVFTTYLATWFPVLFQVIQTKFILDSKNEGWSKWLSLITGTNTRDKCTTKRFKLVKWKRRHGNWDMLEIVAFFRTIISKFSKVTIFFINKHFWW